LEPATYADADLLLEWANDPLTRGNSFNSAPISREEHLRWLQSVIHHDERLVFIATIDSEQIGQVQFTRIGMEAEIGVSVAPAARGRSLGASLILAGVRAARAAWGEDAPIVARIKAANSASRRSFRVAGFLESAASRAADDPVEMRLG
jgi:RimJ/RimL family protein N-acetyltransferase